MLSTQGIQLQNRRVQVNRYEKGLVLTQHQAAPSLILSPPAAPNVPPSPLLAALISRRWPHKFKAIYTIALQGEQLHTELRVHNTDTMPFEFTAALHSYFEVLSVDKAKVTGLKGEGRAAPGPVKALPIGNEVGVQRLDGLRFTLVFLAGAPLFSSSVPCAPGLTYLDKGKDPKNPETKVETRDAITFGSYVDSVYLNAPNHVALEVGTGAAVAISSSGWEDVVTWNPWTTMEACYKNFVCVENAKYGSAAKVQPGGSWTATANFSVVDV